MQNTDLIIASASFNHYQLGMSFQDFIMSVASSSDTCMIRQNSDLCADRQGVKLSFATNRNNTVFLTDGIHIKVLERVERLHIANFAVADLGLIVMCADILRERQCASVKNDVPLVPVVSDDGCEHRKRQPIAIARADRKFS